MKLSGALAALALAALVVGCANKDKEDEEVVLGAREARGETGYPGRADDIETDASFVEAVRDDAVNNAILAQHTLYPYHFIANGEKLNELGRKDLATLANFYRGHPGDVNVRRGDTSNDLYTARVDSVVAALAEAGVDTDRVRIADESPGGTGMASDTVVKIMATPSESYGEDDKGVEVDVTENRTINQQGE